MFAPDIALGMPLSGMQGADLSLSSSGPVHMSSMDQALMQMGHPAGPAPAPQLYPFQQHAGLAGSADTFSSHMPTQVSPADYFSFFVSASFSITVDFSGSHGVCMAWDAAKRF